MKENVSISKFVGYNLVVCFAAYWLSNVVLWYPWSINETLGQILMLTVNPFLWGYASYTCIIRYPRENFFHASLLVSLLFISEAIFSDLIFFGLIRNAMDEIMKATTIYGWYFVVILPPIIYLLLKKKIVKSRKPIVNSDFVKPAAIGVISFFIIIAILILDIRF